MLRKSLSSVKKWLPTIIGTVVIVSIIIFTVPALSSEKFLSLVDKVHPFGPILIVLFVALSQIFAPVPGSPGLVVSFSIFGWGQTWLYVYLGSLLSATVSFYIARKFGRKWVKKFVGKKNMSEVDRFVEAEGVEVLVISRVFGFALFDYISYAVGLTLMSFKTYFIVTALGTGFTYFVYMLLLDGIDLSTTKGILIWYGSMLLIVPIFSLLINNYLKRKKSN